MNSKMKKISSISCAALAILLASCAKDGFDDKEQFVIDVSNAQLEAPTLTAESVAVLVNPDGTKSLKLTWPFIKGAAGFLVNVAKVDNPDTPEYLITDSVIDGYSVIVNHEEETRYKIWIKTLDNPKLNNVGSTQVTELNFDTYLPATIIPAGSELSTFVAANLPDPGEEVAFELEAGKTYKLEGVLDFKLTQVQLRGDKINRPVVEVGENGYITTQSGLDIKNINFDCSAMSEANNASLVRLVEEGDPSIKGDVLGYSGSNAKDVWVIEKPIIIENCWVKDLPCGIFTWGGYGSWVVMDLRINNCIFQLHYSEKRGDKALLGLANMPGNAWANHGLIYGMTIEGNTFYNTEENTKSYFIRYNNASNAQPNKPLGDAYKDQSTHTWKNNTFIRTFTGKDFGNNIQNGVNVYFNSNIFYDTFRINKYTRGKNYFSNNASCAADGRSVDSSDLGNDTNGNPRSTLDEGLNFDYNQVLDFGKENGGLDFRPKTQLTTTNKIGDPRWLE